MIFFTNENINENSSNNSSKDNSTNKTTCVCCSSIVLFFVIIFTISEIANLFAYHPDKDYEAKEINKGVYWGSTMSEEKIKKIIKTYKGRGGYAISDSHKPLKANEIYCYTINEGKSKETRGIHAVVIWNDNKNDYFKVTNPAFK